MFLSTLAATPLPSCTRPSRMCSVPMYSWLKRCASWRARPMTFLARSVKRSNMGTSGRPDCVSALSRRPGRTRRFPVPRERGCHSRGSVPDASNPCQKGTESVDPPRDPEAGSLEHTTCRRPGGSRVAPAAGRARAPFLGSDGASVGLAGMIHEPFGRSRGSGRPCIPNPGVAPPHRCLGIDSSSRLGLRAQDRPEHLVSRSRGSVSYARPCPVDPYDRRDARFMNHPG